MKYSKAHYNLARRLGKNGWNNLDVFDIPEKYLGPNYASVLNFWWYLDSLTAEQLLELEDKYMLEWARNNRRYHTLFSYAEANLGNLYPTSAVNASRANVREIIGKFPNLPAPITLELMTMHTILDSGESLMFVPLVSF